MPLLVAAVGGHRHLFGLWPTVPSAVNWQEPVGQDPSYHGYHGHVGPKRWCWSTFAWCSSPFASLSTNLLISTTTRRMPSKIPSFFLDHGVKTTTTNVSVLHCHRRCLQAGMAMEHRPTTTKEVTDLCGSNASSLPLWLMWRQLT
jgi:hypothetical protein